MAAIVFLLGLAGTAAAVVADRGFAAVSLGTVLVLLVLTGIAAVLSLLLHPRRGRMEVVTAEGRLWFPASRPLPVVTISGLVLCILLPVVLGVGVIVEGTLTAPRTATVGALVLGGVTVPVLVARLRGRTVDPRLGLGPEDVLRESGRSSRRVAWQHVATVELVTDPGPRVMISATRRVDAWHRSKPTAGERPVAGPPVGDNHIPVPTSLHGSDPRLMEMLLQHYHRHPEHRHELGTPAAEGRIERGDFGPGLR